MPMPMPMPMLMLMLMLMLTLCLSHGSMGPTHVFSVEEVGS
jgi:hypothetical protein